MKSKYYFSKGLLGDYFNKRFFWKVKKFRVMGRLKILKINEIYTVARSKQSLLFERFNAFDMIESSHISDFFLRNDIFSFVQNYKNIFF